MNEQELRECLYALRGEWLDVYSTRPMWSDYGHNFEWLESTRRLISLDRTIEGVEKMLAAYE